MPFATRNINYVQNVPQSLGFPAQYFDPAPSRNVRVFFELTYLYACGGQMGQVVVPENPLISVQGGSGVINSSGGRTIILEGPVAEINDALYNATYVSRAYTIEDTDQDVNSVDRAVGNYQGEMLVQLPAGVDTSHLVVGNEIRFSTIGNSTSAYRFTITKVDFTNSPVRVWSVFNRDYTVADLHMGSPYKNVRICKSTSATCMMQKPDGTDIGPVIDLAFQNAQGYLPIRFGELDGGTTPVFSFINMIGAPMIAEPTFLTQPTAVVNAFTENTWMAIGSIGTIAQDDNNYQTIQLLIKALENDPKYLDVNSYTELPGYPAAGTELQKLKFIGDAIDLKARFCIPKYITDKSYGTFGDAQLNDRASVTNVADGEVRWSYYDTPAGINAVSSPAAPISTRVLYYRPLGFTKDFNLEVRVVNDRDRIYSDRGK